MREAIKQRNIFLIKFSSNIYQNLSPKVGKSMCAWKFNKKSLPGSPFWAKDRFLVDFRVPAGSQNWQFWGLWALHALKGFWHFSKKRPDQSLEAPEAPQGPSRDLQETLRGTPRHHFGSFFQLKFRIIFSLLYFISFFLACSVSVLELPLIRGDRETLDR